MIQKEIEALKLGIASREYFIAKQAKWLDEKERQLGKAYEEIEKLLDALEDITSQACFMGNDKPWDSMALSANAHAMRVLSDHGILEITKEVGRRVIANYIRKQEEMT